MANWLRLQVLQVSCVCLALVGISTAALPQGKAGKERPGRLKVSENVSPRPADRAIFTSNYFNSVRVVGFLEGGVLGGSFDMGVSGNYGPPAGGGTSETGGFFGGTIEVSIPLFAPPPGPPTRFPPLSASRPVSPPIPRFVDPSRPPAPFFGAPVFGVQFHTFTSRDGVVFVTIHPAPSAPTELSFTPDFSVTPYVGLPLVFPDGFGSQQPVVVTPWIGINLQNGQLQIRTDQLGVVDTLAEDVTRTGLAVGINADVVFQAPGGGVPIIIGGGVFANFFSDESFTGRSRLFQYTTRVDSSVEFGAKVRLGVVLSDFWIQGVNTGTELRY
jgi:hypothetical protein